MKRPRVSIIMPVYNTREYLEEALGSISRQKMDDIEVIAIDDGSNDGCSEILKKWSSRLDMIILTKPNNGPAAARNDGLDIAAGDYIFFMDSDDWIEPETLERCVELCDKSNLDFVFFDAVPFCNDGAFSEDEIKSFDFHSAARYPHSQSGPKVLTDKLDNGCYCSQVWLSLFRRTFLMKNALRFKDIRHEDELFTALAYLIADRVKGISKEFLHCRLRSGSVLTTSFCQADADGYLVIAKDVQKEGKRPECTRAKRKLISGYMFALMQNGANLSCKTKGKITRTILFRYPYSFRFKPFFSFLFKKGRIQ